MECVILSRCDVITRSHLQLINTSIDTFWNQEEEGRPMMVKRKLNGAVEESLADQDIDKSNATVHNL